MITELVVKNLGVIEDAAVLLGPGLTALTGETGAGKTLVTEAIGLLTGGRADPLLVRTGADEAVVEGRFVTGDGTEVVVRRVVPSNGRSRAYLDGGLSTATALAETVGPLIEIHGQHGQQVMLRTPARRAALDRYGGHDLGPLQQAQSELRQARAELDSLGGDELARNREIDLLQFQVDEIEAVGLSDATEDEQLAARELLLGDAEALGAAAESAIEVLSADGSLGVALAQAINALRDKLPFASTTERLLALQAEVGDIADELRDQSSSFEHDPAALHQIQARREQITGLRRKYGTDVAAVLEFWAETSERLDQLKNHSERAEQVTERLAVLEAAKTQAASELLAARQASAPTLAKAVETELRQLALPKAEFVVDPAGESGGEVEFAVSMNPGAPVLPMAKVASGGELSRIMLALQLVVGGDTETVVYDEVDAGVGGEAASAIGRALAGVGRNHQVLVVTHLPQVAAFADQQVNIVKNVHGSSTITELHQLDLEGRIVELARMLSGSPDSDNARAHAAELLEIAAS